MQTTLTQNSPKLFHILYIRTRIYNIKKYLAPSTNMSEDLVQCSMDTEPSSPISFLEQAATTYGDKISIMYNDNVRFSWRETHQRCVKLASALVNLGISHNDIVSLFTFQSTCMHINIFLIGER